MKRNPPQADAKTQIKNAAKKLRKNRASASRQRRDCA
jgi:hypothetical protein